MTTINRDDEVDEDEDVYLTLDDALNMDFDIN